MKKIADNVYGILTRFNLLNQYIIVNGTELTVVDMMLGASDVDNLEKELKTQNWSLEQVQHLLITHAHPDHIGGLKAFQERSNATTYAHRLDAQVIRGEAEGAVANPEELGWFNRFIYNISKGNKQPEPSRVDVDLSDGDTLTQIANDLTVVHLPGHSHGQVGYYLASQRLLIGGDVMMRLGGSLRMPLRAVSPDWDAVKHSIQRVADLDIDILCLGHGKPLYNANKVIEKFATKAST